MKYTIVFISMLFVVSCQTISSKTESKFEEQRSETFLAANTNQTIASIREIDFQNFTFPWSKTFSGKQKSFSLKKGFSNTEDGRKLSLKSLLYIEVAEDFDEQALVNVKIDDGNATYEMLYVFALENGKPKLLEKFEFGKNNIFFRTAFAAHGELIIETFHQLSGDAECCPSVIEIAYYKWQKDKFVLQTEPQKISNLYVERSKKK